MLMDSAIWHLNNENISDKTKYIVVKIFNISDLFIPLLTLYSHTYTLSLPMPWAACPLCIYEKCA